ncbi:MAG: PRC-barrel domain-containing protein, partial [Thermoplasmatota archaeon]
MLIKKMEECKVVNTVGEPIGKIREAYIDLEKWEIKAFEISPGTLKKNIILDLRDLKKVDIEDRTIMVRD